MEYFLVVLFVVVLFVVVVAAAVVVFEVCFCCGCLFFVFVWLGWLRVFLTQIGVRQKGCHAHTHIQPAQNLNRGDERDEIRFKNKKMNRER